MNRVVVARGLRRGAVGVAAWAVLAAVPAVGQPVGAETLPLPAVFVGAGGGPSTNDAAARMRLFQEGWAATWLVEAGIAVNRRIGIGIEYSQPSAAKAFTTVGLGRAQIAGRQEERVLLGTVRARLGSRRRAALDAVAGAGVLFQHHEAGGCVPARATCETTVGPGLDERAPAFVAGLEAPVRVAAHFELAIAARVYALRRATQTSLTNLNLSWQYEFRPSTRAAAVVIGRVVW